jgi:membrane-bound hydrogenase subunit beta
MYKAMLNFEARPAEELKSFLEEKLGNKIKNIEIRARTAGKEEKVAFHDLWISCSKDALIELVDLLSEFDFPIFHVISGDDVGDCILLNYHFSLFSSAGRGKRLGVVVSVLVPKNELSVPSLYDRIPGIEYSEREMHEMLGVFFDGLPDQSLVFLPEDWDEKVHPWRRDESGVSSRHIRELS